MDIITSDGGHGLVVSAVHQCAVVVVIGEETADEKECEDLHL